MSLFNSIAYPSTAKARSISLRGLAAIAMALVLGGAVGAIMVGDRGSDASQAAAVADTGLPHDEFIRLNTTEMDHLSPVTAAHLVEPAPTVDPFLYWNTTALDSLVPVVKADEAKTPQVSEEFLRWNVDSLEYSGSAYSEQPSGPR